MAIWIQHTWPPFDPNDTDQNIAYLKCEQAANNFFAAYQQASSILGLFSVKKQEAVNIAEQDYKIARKEYHKILFGSMERGL